MLKLPLYVKVYYYFKLRQELKAIIFISIFICLSNIFRTIYSIPF